MRIKYREVTGYMARRKVTRDKGRVTWRACTDNGFVTTLCRMHWIKNLTNGE